MIFLKFDQLSINTQTKLFRTRYSKIILTLLSWNGFFYDRMVETYMGKSIGMIRVFTTSTPPTNKRISLMLKSEKKRI
jgi:hypothetical protein